MRDGWIDRLTFAEVNDMLSKSTHILRVGGHKNLSTCECFLITHNCMYMSGCKIEVNMVFVPAGVH